MKKKEDLQIYGLFGHPLSHSLSPAIQEEAFRQRNLMAHYLLFDINPTAIKRVFKSVKTQSVSGFNLTVPYKESIIPFLDDISDEAHKIGAVNTVVRRENKWVGENTDAYGFIESLKTEGRFEIKGKTACVLGAGGASKAVIYGLGIEKVAEIYLLNRTVERAEKLKEKFQKYFPKIKIISGMLRGAILKEAVQKSDLIVNTTSVGLKKKSAALMSSSLIPKATVRKKKLFYDLIYYPRETKLLKSARTKGHAVLNGSGMLVYQGAKAFEYWTRRVAPVKSMRKAFDVALAERKGS